MPNRSHESISIPPWKELSNPESQTPLDQREVIARKFENEILQNVRNMVKVSWFGRSIRAEGDRRVFSTTNGPRMIFREWAHGTAVATDGGDYLVSPTSRPVQLAARELVNLLQASGKEEALAALRLNVPSDEDFIEDALREKDRFLHELQGYYFRNKPSEGTSAEKGFFVTTPPYVPSWQSETIETSAS